MSRVKGFAIAFFLLVFMAGCGTAGQSVKKDMVPTDNARAGFIQGVPFFPQERYMCGPAALASVFAHYGHKAGMREVAGKVYEPSLKGSLPIDLLVYAKTKGFAVNYYMGGLDDLKARVDRSEPLILFLNLGHKQYPLGHYIVVLGYDDKEQRIIAHSGEKEMAYTYKELLRSWGKTNFATLLVTPAQNNERLSMVRP